MSQSNKSNEYSRLFKQYNIKSDEELSKIINPENGYTEIARKVASDILNSDRTEYYKNTELREKQIKEEQEITKDDIFLHISSDIHSIKNMLLFFMILTIIGLLFGVYTVFITMPNLF